MIKNLNQIIFFLMGSFTALIGALIATLGIVEGSILCYEGASFIECMAVFNPKFMISALFVITGSIFIIIGEFMEGYLKNDN